MDGIIRGTTMKQVCINCKRSYELDEIVFSCKSCGDLLEISITKDEIEYRIKSFEWKRKGIKVWDYLPFLPFNGKINIVSLGEGGTPLIKCDKISKILKIGDVFVKNEGANPTGSFKDRGMTVGVTKALLLKARIVACASTGNTSSSLSAYAAKSSLRCLVFVPSGKIALGKLAQARVYGAEIYFIDGNFDKALSLVIDIVKRNKDVYLLNSVNPFRIEGQKTLAFEICDQLRKVPDKVIMPVGNAGNISACWKGFVEYYKLGLIDKLPKMIGVQAKGASPIADAIINNKDEIEKVSNPETVATAIRIGAPVSWKKAIRAIRESKGTAVKVSDEEILDAQRFLASNEGIFVEPASAASIAGLRRLADEGKISKDETVVCVATGHGLKDPDAPLIGFKPNTLPANLEQISKILVIKR
jgi:threonine synthase